MDTSVNSASFYPLLVVGFFSLLGYLYLKRDSFLTRWEHGKEFIQSRPIGHFEAFSVLLLILTLYMLPALVIKSGLFQSQTEQAAFIGSTQQMNVAFYTIVTQFLIIFSCVSLVLMKSTLKEAFGFTRNFEFPKLFPRVISILLVGLPFVLAIHLTFQLIEQYALADGETLKHQPAVDSLQNSIKEPFTLTLLIIAAVVMAPIAEEITFRGIFLPYLAKKTNLYLAIIITSLFFALIHFHFTSFVPLTLLGVLFAVGYIYNQNLLGAIVMHSLFNLLNVVMLLIKATQV